MVGKVELVWRIISKNKEGSTISEIAKESKCSRNTVRIYIERLVGKDKITIRKIGPSKLIIPRKWKLMKKIF